MARKYTPNQIKTMKEAFRNRIAQNQSNKTYNIKNYLNRKIEQMRRTVETKGDINPVATAVERMVMKAINDDNVDVHVKQCGFSLNSYRNSAEQGTIQVEIAVTVTARHDSDLNKYQALIDACTEAKQKMADLERWEIDALSAPTGDTTPIFEVEVVASPVECA